jgi:hypothetical protein
LAGLPPDGKRMNTTEFNYDVAFSFLQKDEGLAMQLNDLLQDRVKTFIYSEQQKALAGTDGEEVFNRVFREESRLVVVLYRAGWGETKWTRVEQTAIRARGFDHGYGFAKFIPLDEPENVPPWLPPTQIYIGLKRFGIEGAAAVIEERIRDLGGNVHQETVEEHAQRIGRQIAFDKRRAHFQREEGVHAAQAQLVELKRVLTARAESVKNSTAIPLQIAARQDGFWMIGLDCALGIAWRSQYGNTLENAHLLVFLYSHLPAGPGQFMFEKPTLLKSQQFEFDLLPSEVGGWIMQDGQPSNFSTDALAEYLIKFYLKHGRG